MKKTTKILSHFGRDGTPVPTDSALNLVDVTEVSRKHLEIDEQSSDSKKFDAKLPPT
jgi:hypothetical protein